VRTALIALTACAAAPAAPREPTIRDQEAAVVLRVATLWGATIQAITWKHCDDLNGNYVTARAEVELCDRNDERPCTALFYAAHEAAHAVTYQLAGTVDEASADEVAAIALLRLGLRAVVLEQAAAWRGDPAGGGPGAEGAHVRGDPHPGFAYRAWAAERLASDPAALTDAASRWDRRLAEPQQ